MNLGLCYLKGWGVSKDLFEARRWLQNAAQQREPGAVAKLAELDKDPDTRDLVNKATPGRGGRWLESYWLLDRQSQWDCTGTELMLADTAQARTRELTERYGPPKVTIVTEGVPDYVVLTWTTGAGSETRLKQYGCEQEHVKPPAE
jgi:TPR repeat protein